MPLVFDLLRWGSAAALGIFAGAMLTEGGVLVPFWRSLPPADFLRWYGANGDRLLAFFSPVTTAAAVLALLAAGVSLWEGHAGRWWALAAAVLALATVVSFFMYFERANTSFAEATIAIEAVSGELARWGAWHTARTVVSVLAFGAALLAVRPNGP